MSLPMEATALANAVLKGDELAAGVLADCVLENYNGGGGHITKQYVDHLEDALRETKRVLIHARKQFNTPYDNEVTAELTKGELKGLMAVYWKVEQEARTLGRSGSW